MRIDRNRAAAVCWTLVILALCSIPGQDIPKVEMVQIDKFAHVGIFFIFGMLWLRVVPGTNRFLWVFLGGVFYAIFTEIYQGWLPWDRTPDVMDAIANIAGLIASIGFSVWRS